MSSMMGASEIAEYLKVNKQTIYNWVSKKEMPFAKIGDLLRFNKGEIDRWIRNRTFRPDIIAYNGYEIEAVPYQLAQSNEWQININILKHHGSHSVTKNFSAGNCFPTKEEAVKRCYNFGVKIIDGKIQNCSVGGL